MPSRFVTRPAPDPHDRGSVFIESLVASAIVAMILVATLRVVADGAAHTREVEDRRVALMVARSELAAVGAEIPLEPGENGGLSGNMLWSVRIAPYDDLNGSGALASAAGRLWNVRVGVRPRGARRDLAVLETLRLGPKEL